MTWFKEVIAIAFPRDVLQATEWIPESAESPEP